jgi:hypothetical protein
MIVTLWTVTYNDDAGSPSSEIYTSERDADRAALAWVRTYESNHPDVEYRGDDWKLIFEQLCEQSWVHGQHLHRKARRRIAGDSRADPRR